ncbi:MAG: ABC transporter permease [Bacillota bacterium]
MPAIAYRKLKGIRDAISRALVPIVALLLALGVGLLLIVALGLDPKTAMEALFKGAFGSKSAVGETIVKMTPLILTGLSFALANRCGLINLGAEGQLYIGGLCSVIVALYLHLPSFLHIPLAVAAGFIGGGLWGMLAGFFKVRFGANEMITTIMLNYVATYFANYMVMNVMVEPPGTMPQTPPVLATAQLPRLLEGTRIHAGILIALLCILIYYVFLWKMRSGFETRVVGLNPDAASYAGINNKRKALLAMFLAGGFAGLAGTMELLGIQLRMFQNFSPGYGFDGIAVALLGQNSPVGILFSALMFGALRSGSNLMQMTAKVPAASIYIIQSLVIIFVVGSRFMTDLQKKWAIKREAKGDR